MDQKHNVNDITSVGNFISLFYRNGVTNLSHEFAKYDIGYGQIQFLVKLYLEDGLKHDELTKIVHVDKATTTRAIGKLSDNGYVDVRQDSEDKRIYRVYLTEKAMEIREEVLAIVTAWEDQLLGALTEDESKTLFDLCNKVAIYNQWIEPSSKDNGLT
nr:MarR family transcriptional regulator [uncultured Anaerosporobacter sp.]